MSIKALIKFAAPIFIVLDIFRMVEGLYWLYYITQLMLLFFIISLVYEIFKKNIIPSKDIFKLIFLFLLFPLWTIATSNWSLNPWLTFLKGINFNFVVLGIFGIVILWLKYVKINFFLSFLPANLLIVSVSLLSLVSGIPSDAWNVGHGLSFAGVFAHQNVMAMALMFTLPGVFSLISNKNNYVIGINISQEQAPQNFKKIIRKYIYYLLISLNLFLIVLTYSRSVIIGLFSGFIFFLIITKAYRILILIGTAFTLVLIFYLTITPLNERIYNVLSKHGWDILATRTILWEPSFEAAKLGGIEGIGYGMSAEGIYIYGPEDLSKSEENYYREKGNSVLAIIEETGLIGVIIILSSFILWFRKIFENKSNIQFLILASFAFGFIVQSNFEAWIGGGSPFLQLFLTLIIYPVLVKSLKFNPNNSTTN